MTAPSSALGSALARAGLLVDRRWIFRLAVAVITGTVIGSWAYGGVFRALLPPVVVLFPVVLAMGIFVHNLGLFVPVVARGPADSGGVFLTFDDGPDPVYTPRILDVLRAHGARATFFPIGEQAERHPEIVRRIVEEGHGLGCHTRSHPALLNLYSTKRLAAEIRQGRAAVEAAAGRPVRWYRQVAGIVNPRLNRALAGTGLVLVGWTARALEGRAKSPEDLRRRILEGVDRWARPGAIYNLHDRGIYRSSLPEGVVLALPDLLAALASKGLATKTLDEMFADGLPPAGPSWPRSPAETRAERPDRSPA